MDTAKRRFVCIIRSAPWITFLNRGGCRGDEKDPDRIWCIYKGKLGNVLVSHKGDRFCFHIPEQGAEYVHEHMKPNEFIRELVELVGKHGCTMQQVKDLFLSKGKQVQMEPMDNGEFDLMIRFEGDGEDPYYYCFKDEGCHIIYHRFLPEDYADFGF